MAFKVCSFTNNPVNVQTKILHVTEGAKKALQGKKGLFDLLITCNSEKAMTCRIILIGYKLILIPPLKLIRLYNVMMMRPHFLSN